MYTFTALQSDSKKSSTSSHMKSNFISPTATPSLTPAPATQSLIPPRPQTPPSSQIPGPNIVVLPATPSSRSYSCLLNDPFCAGGNKKIGCSRARIETAALEHHLLASVREGGAFVVSAELLTDRLKRLSAHLCEGILGKLDPNKALAV